MPTPTRPQLIAYALAAAIVVVLGVRFMQGQARTGSGSAGGASAMASGGDGAGGDEAASGAGTDGSGGSGAGGSGGAGGGAPSSVGLEPADTTALVHVAGAVRRPGVYRFHAGDRVKDAVTRAGGARKGADLDAINLAAKVADGQQVVVPRRGAAGSAPAAGGSAASSGSTPASPVSLNSASEEQLETLDGVGPATAQKILDWRQQHGGFRTVDDLAEVPGIGPKRLAALKPKVQL
jgi:competence protein ComEA